MSLNWGAVEEEVPEIEIAAEWLMIADQLGGNPLGNRCRFVSQEPESGEE